MREEKLQLGINALDYVKNIPDKIFKKIDTVVWDPPYYDDDNKEDLEKVNTRSKLRGKDNTVFMKNNSARIMDADLRSEILEFIRSKGVNHIIHFHTKEDYKYSIPKIACEHVWVKPIIISIAGNADRNNGEFIFIEGDKIEGRPKGQILSKYINAGFNKKFSPRSCAKPLELYTELFRHVKSRFILDPFAGYGNSIGAARKFGISVYACDTDNKLRYNHNWRYNLGFEDYLPDSVPDNIPESKSNQDTVGIEWFI